MVVVERKDYKKTDSSVDRLLIAQRKRSCCNESNKWILTLLHMHSPGPGLSVNDCVNRAFSVDRKPPSLIPGLRSCSTDGQCPPTEQNNTVLKISFPEVWTTYMKIHRLF